MIVYHANAIIDFGYHNHILKAEQTFYILSAISRRQLVACQEEAVRSITVSPIPPLSAQFQTFACKCMGNLCCLSRNSAIDVEVLIQSSRALVMSDSRRTRQVIEEYYTLRDAEEHREDSCDDEEDSRSESCAPRRRRRRNASINNHDNHNHNKENSEPAPGENIHRPHKTERCWNCDPHEIMPPHYHAHSAHSTSTVDSLFRQHVVAGYDYFGERRHDLQVYRTARTPRADQLVARASAELIKACTLHREALRQQRAAAEAALPMPAGQLPLLVRVVNRCTRYRIRRIRIELRVMVRVFKSLDFTRTFAQPLARYDHLTCIVPGAEETFSAHLLLPRHFRHDKREDEALLPPTGVRTVNMCTLTQVSVTFPGLPTYEEEEDWAAGAVQLAERVDLSDEVLDLPARYS